MNIEDLLKSLELPKKYYDSNFDISEKYAEEAKIFIEGIGNIDGAEFADKDKQEQIQEKFKLLIPIAEENVCRILDVFKYYEGSDPKRAQEEFDAMMDSLASVIFISTIDDWNSVDTSKGKMLTSFRMTRGTKFYRVRGVKEKSDDIENNPDELFHIPLSKKALTNNERFSLAGFPSLYLATMLPLAWQESGYPQKYYYSEYQYLNNASAERKMEDELQILALYSPREIFNWGISIKHNDFQLWLDIIYRCMMMYPLVMACSFVNHSGKGTYKQEYVIPQMLMQWVQRNNETVQGISYFTCVDISMMPSEYCAYNIVIPALKPYDAKKYSQRLRDEFIWTVPQYFEIPLFNVEDNKDDRKLIYEFINKIRNFYKMGLPDSFRSYLDDIERVCVCLYHLMQSGSDSDMQMIIHTLNLINVSHQQIKVQSIEKIIEAGKKSNMFLSEDDFETAILRLKEISQEFLVADRKINNIAVIIDKYRNTVWNDYPHESVLEIVFRKGENTQEIETWCREHHLLYDKHILSNDDSQKLGKPVSEIITPLVIRLNSISIYDKVEYQPVDYIREGFDPSLHGNEIISK